MEVKRKSAKLVNFEEELLPTGRKLLHCIFENRYGSGFQYKWTAPWRDRGGEYGAMGLFVKCIEVEEWNDFDGVWSEELRKVSKEVPCLEEMVLPVKIEIGGLTEDVRVVEIEEDKEVKLEYIMIDVNILSDEESVTKDIINNADYIKVGSVSMAWELLKSELIGIKKVDTVSEGIRTVVLRFLGGSGSYVDVEGVSFGVLVYRTVNKNEYQVISREIASCIRRFIRIRLSEYRQIRKGFEEEG